jgi:hypothetical protein
MKTRLSNPYVSSRLVRVLTVMSVLLSALGVTVSSMHQNPNVASTLLLTSTDDGFDGVFYFQGREYGIQNRASKGSFTTQITRPDGRPLVLGLRKADVISVAFPTAEVKVNTAKPVDFSAKEITAINDFDLSDEAALVRRIIYEVRNRRITEKRPLLVGFRVIAMLLGDGDVEISSAEKNIDRSKLTFKLAGYKCDQPSTSVKSKPPTCDSSNCCGCCGPGCWGCTGCYTEACLAHDLCVDQLGYFNRICMAILPIAIASAAECGQE